jgi:hypothetical protein
MVSVFRLPASLQAENDSQGSLPLEDLDGARMHPSGNEEFGVLDAYGEKAYWSPTNVSAALLDREIATIDAELKRIMG